MKKKNLLIALTSLMLLPLTSCGEENKYVRLAIYNSTEGSSLFVAGNARDQVKTTISSKYDPIRTDFVANYKEEKGNTKVLFINIPTDKLNAIKYDEYDANNQVIEGKTVTVTSYIDVSNYVLCSDSANETLEALQRAKSGVEIAFIPVSLLNDIKITNANGLSIVYIDTYTTTGEISGIWVAKDSWLKNAPNYSRKFIQSLVKCQNYCVNNTSGSYTDCLNAIEADDYNKIYDFSSYNNVNDYLAIFTKQCVRNIFPKNISDITAKRNAKYALADNPYTRYSLVNSANMYKDFNNNQGEGYTKCLDLYNAYIKNVDDAKSFDDAFNLDLMMAGYNTYSKIFNN